MTTVRHEAHAAMMADLHAIAMIAGRLATVMIARVASIVIHVHHVVVMTGHVVSIGILVLLVTVMIALVALIEIRVRREMVAIDRVVSTGILVHRVTVMIALAVSIGTRVHHDLIATLVLLVMVMIVHVASTEIHALHASIAIPVHRVTVMIALVVSIVILERVTVMIAHAVLTAMIVLVVSIVMIAHVALIATTAHPAQQRKNVQTKCVVALANAVRPEKCQQRQSVHVKSGLTKGQCVRNVIQTWVAFAPKAQAVRKKADEKKCVHSTPLWNSLSVH
jgi:hypothetical protein